MWIQGERISYRTNLFKFSQNFRLEYLYEKFAVKTNSNFDRKYKIGSKIVGLLFICENRALGPV